MGLMSLGASADTVRVISYGADLSDIQRDKVYQMFGLQPSEKPDITA